GDSMFKEICEKYAPTKDNLIFILHDIQDSHPQHYISEEAVQTVSEYLSVPANHIYGVLTFYSMYSTKPRGNNIIRLCESAPCYIKVSDNILRNLKTLLGVNVGETTKDGVFTLELAACLGVCGNAPVMMINDDVFGDLNEDKIEEIIAKIKGGK
ncbi:MAG: NAD(P)H-dependent oxidoreductase subunit E, partial [Candidatus Cloacimonadaceae bacterium]|nr:NAD(P)H-dependent oxidoreductase subunit E [Candidatus Cloacimonadaceae bacterium]